MDTQFAAKKQSRYKLGRKNKRSGQVCSISSQALYTIQAVTTCL